MFKGAKAVRLRRRHEKYLIADDEEHICQDRNGTSHAARWNVEFVPDAPAVLRLKSCFGRYLTASNEPFLLVITGAKSSKANPTAQTHHVQDRTATEDWVLWDVNIIDLHVEPSLPSTATAGGV